VRYRNKCLNELIRPFFYRPSVSRDCQAFIKGCDACQKMDKARPPRSPMQQRETVTIPFERVAIDIVGSFPTATGGFKFLLTCIDMATRWPEAIPVRNTTARTIINQLTGIFCRCGFPTAIVSDNGPQFVGKFFSK